MGLAINQLWYNLIKEEKFMEKAIVKFAFMIAIFASIEIRFRIVRLRHFIQFFVPHHEPYHPLLPWDLHLWAAKIHLLAIYHVRPLHLGTNCPPMILYQHQSRLFFPFVHWPRQDCICLKPLQFHLSWNNPVRNSSGWSRWIQIWIVQRYWKHWWGWYKMLWATSSRNVQRWDEPRS